MELETAWVVLGVGRIAMGTLSRGVFIALPVAICLN